MNVKEFRARIEQYKGRKAQIEEQVEKAKENLYANEERQITLEKALAVVREVALSTQRLLQYNLSDIVSSAMEAIFPDPYCLDVQFETKRGKTECNISFERNGNIVDPIESSGVGAVDVAAFALRIAAWSMNYPKTRPVLILDEPFKFLSLDLIPFAGRLVKNLSEQLGLQIIMVTHSEALAETADCSFAVSKKNGVSLVKKITPIGV